MSDFFDSIGLGFLDPGILILVLFALFIVVLILVITDISGRKSLSADSTSLRLALTAKVWKTRC